MKTMIPLLVLLFAAGGTLHAAAKPWLYMLNARSGELVPSAEGGHELVLKNVTPDTLIFTDEGEANVQTVSTARFIESWKSSGAENVQSPVVAALDPAEGGEGPVGLELSDPVYEAGAGEIRYKAKPLEGKAESRSFGVSTLFVEAAAAGAAQEAGIPRA